MTRTAKADRGPPTDLHETGRNVIIGLAAILAAAAAALLAGVALVPAPGMRATGLPAAPLVLLAAAGASRAR